MSNKNYEEDWAIYLGQFGENRVGSIIVDLGLNQIAPVKSKNRLLKITFFINDFDEDGFPTKDESDKLNRIEDNLIEKIVKSYKAIYAGRITVDGKLHSLFYAGNTAGIDDTISAFIAQNPDYRLEYDLTNEDNWNTYFQRLFPSPIEMQGIQNDLVIRNLESYGDNLEKEREVDHWIYFASKTDRENFLESITEEGFKVIDKSEISSDENPFALHLSRIDKVDYESVNEYTIFLWEKAQKFNGHYDGWETFVVKD